MSGLVLSAAMMAMALAVLFGGIVILTPFLVDLCLLVLALSGSHAVVGLADASG